MPDVPMRRGQRRPAEGWGLVEFYLVTREFPKIRGYLIFGVLIIRILLLGVQNLRMHTHGTLCATACRATLPTMPLTQVGVMQPRASHSLPRE